MPTEGKGVTFVFNLAVVVNLKLTGVYSIKSSILPRAASIASFAFEGIRKFEFTNKTYVVFVAVT
jgi:hypothetical protein